MNYYIDENGTLCEVSDQSLMHYGVKGMRWGHRKNPERSSGGISGAIRRRQVKNANRDLSDTRSKLKDVDDELNELKGYEKNPSAIGKTRIASSIRRHQIKSLEKTKADLKAREKDDVDTLDELDKIEKYQAQKRERKNTEKADRKQSAEMRKKSRSAHIENDRRHTSASNTIKYTKAAAIGSASAIGTAVIGSAATHMLAKNGKTQAASTVYKLSRTAFDAAKMYSQVSAGAAFMSAAMTSKESMRDYRAEEKRIREKYGS